MDELNELGVLNPHSSHCVQVFILTARLPPGRPPLDEEFVAILEASKIEDATEVVAVSVDEPDLVERRSVYKRVRWGFLCVDELPPPSPLGLIELHKTDFQTSNGVDRAWVPSHCSFTPIPLHDSFDWYARPLITARELSLDEVHRFYRQRISLYNTLVMSPKSEEARRKLILANQHDVLCDSVGFFTILHAVASLQLSGVASHSTLLETFAYLEQLVASTRTSRCHPHSFFPSLIDSDDVRCLSIHELRALFPQAAHRMSKWKPLARTVYRCRLEIAWPLMKDRSAMLMLSHAYTTLPSIKRIAVVFAKRRVAKWVDRIASIHGGEAWQRDVRLRRIAADALKSMKSLSDALVGGVLYTPLASEAELARVAATSPSCIKHLLDLCKLDTPGHLNNSGRLLLSQFLLFAGWNPLRIKQFWSPKITIAYSPSEPAQKEASSTIEYVKRKRMIHPFSCEWAMQAKLCPMLDKHTSAAVAVRECKRGMHVDPDSRPSPVAFTRAANPTQ
jgi:hypothetical protein